MSKQAQTALDLESINQVIDAACRQIAPLWPLASHVAVNPYLGQSHQRLAETAAQLTRIGAGPVTRGRQWFLERIAKGEIAAEDLAEALEASPYKAKPSSSDKLMKLARQPKIEARGLPSVADLAATVSGCDWPGILADRIGAWAASHFDAGQALWLASQGKPAWAAYRMTATHDITPEVVGLKGFAAFVAEAPDSASQSIAGSLERLAVTQPSAQQSYCHQMLHSLGGWAQYARYLLWRAELAGERDGSLSDLLAIRLLWEEALYIQYEAEIAADWSEIVEGHGAAFAPSEADILDEILQEAAERASQRALADLLASQGQPLAKGRPLVQAAFCIDVRSEVFRRALEAQSSDIQTLGFAGFFGMFANHKAFASDVEELHLPVLLTPTVQTSESHSGDQEAEFSARVAARAKRAWGRFKMAAVSSFAFVEAMGPVYGLKLLSDGLQLKSGKAEAAPQPQLDPSVTLETRTQMAETILRAMSLTDGFGQIVLLAGHGAKVVNNPHASGLHCGACGGYSGEVNARLLAALLNDPEVRGGLVGRGIAIPTDTLFLAGLHDTTTDALTLYAQDVQALEQNPLLEKLQGWLAAAGAQARAERAPRLPRAARAEDIAERALNWAEVRPEWGLAGCSAFIAAPRSRTQGRELAGRCFLHDYDWKLDEPNDFGVLELIMTAPVVVASWISLQYYGSAVAPDVFGAGNKLLHNVVGGIGVLEGNGGVMRAGLPWQSVHNGKVFVHEPLRLSVCIEAPREAMTEILRRHEAVRALFDNRWLHLFALDETGQMAWRYSGGLAWAPVQDEQNLCLEVAS